MIKAIIFDFFGVIGQSTYAMMNEQFNLSENQKAQLKDLHKALDYEFIRNKDFLNDYAKVAGVSLDQVKQIYNNSNQRFSTMPQMLEYIVDLKKTYKIALLSNVSSEAYHQFIKPIKDYFDVVVTSYQVQLAKPERAIFEYCANQLGVDPSECIMIDDSLINCEGAGTAAMQSIQYKNFIQLKTDLGALLADSNN